MKPRLLAALVSVSLLLPFASGSAKEGSEPAAELQKLVRQIQTKVDEGKKSKADLAVELKKFGSLLEEFKDRKTDEVADILFTEAKLYLQVLDDTDTSRKLAERLKRDYPKTTQGKMADQLLGFITAHEEAKRIQTALVLGTEFPAFEEKDVDRKPLSLSDYRGRVVLLDFWATWSKLSVAELDNTLKVYEQCHGQGFEIIGISLDMDEMVVTGFKVRRGIPWQQFFDGGGWKNKLAVRSGVNRLPANYLLDREGKIIGKNLFGSELQKEVTRALSQK
jgi:peroxiredoxin